ncbi:hypothetical protein ACLEPN_09880 [Myxococcus sp. 1LA]
MKGLLYVGLALLALWVVLTVTRAVVGGLLWGVLLVGIAAVAVYAFQVASGRRQIRR